MRGSRRFLRTRSLRTHSGFFDPLIPIDNETAIWDALDGHVARHGAPAVLLTIFWHVRSSQQILDRYEGAFGVGARTGPGWIGGRVRYTSTFNVGGTARYS